MKSIRKRISDAELDRQLREAAKRPVTEPEAVYAGYKDGRINIDLASGWSFSFDPKEFSEFDGAAESDLKKIGLWGHYTLGCEPLDVHISIGGIILKLLGEPFINSEVSRRNGSATSDKKKLASRQNGKLGGRPKKTVLVG